MSPAVTAVVQPVSVELCAAVFAVIAGAALATMVLAIVGIAVPLAIFQISQVIVPVSTVAAHDWIAQANGEVKYPTLVVARTEPPPSKAQPIDLKGALIAAQPVTLPLAKTPVGACPTGHKLGALDSAAAVDAAITPLPDGAKLPVTLLVLVQVLLLFVAAALVT
jgi:hypothetical protein